MNTKKNVYVVSAGEVLTLLAWSKSKAVADEYAKNYAQLEEVEETICVGKMKLSQIMESLSDSQNIYDYELVYMGHGLYVPDKYRGFYQETAEVLREKEQTVMDVLKVIEMSGNAKTRAGISITRKAVKRYFKKQREKLLKKEVCEEWIELNNQFKNSIR